MSDAHLAEIATALTSIAACLREFSATFIVFTIVFALKKFK